jgi:hypothetical protein
MNHEATKTIFVASSLHGVIAFHLPGQAGRVTFLRAFSGDS